MFTSTGLLLVKNGLPIGVTLHAYCVKNLQRYLREGWVAVDNCEKKTHPEVITDKTFCITYLRPAEHAAHDALVVTTQIYTLEYQKLLRIFHYK